MILNKTIWKDLMIKFGVYIKYEAFEGNPSFVENNDLDVHISNIKLS